ncbi:MAG: HEAT repeat domain-containing protein [Nitrospiria bacterium]
MKTRHMQIWGLLALLLTNAACGASSADSDPAIQTSLDTATEIQRDNPKQAASLDVEIENTAASSAGKEASFEAKPETQKNKNAIRAKGGRLRLEVEDASLETVLDEISIQSEIPIVRPDNLGSERISAQIDNLHIEDGLRQILKKQDVFFFFKAKTETEEKPENGSAVALAGVWVFQKGEGHTVSPTPPQQWAGNLDAQQSTTSPDPLKRAGAIEHLVSHRDEQAEESVLMGLNDWDENVRARSLNAALNASMPLEMDKMYELVQHDPSEVVRFMALDAIANQAGETGTDDVNLAAIVEIALEDASPKIREQARLIFTQLNPPPEEEATDLQPQAVEETSDTFELSEPPVELPEWEQQQ